MKKIYLIVIVTILSCLSFSIFAAQNAGDINNDGIVDIADFRLLLREFGKKSASSADADNNNVVDLFDYNLVASSPVFSRYPLKVPVLVLQYFPDQNNDGRIDQDIAGTSETIANMKAHTDKITNQLVAALNFGSKYHGYKNANVTSSLNYSIYETKEFIQPIPREKKDPNVSSPADHMAILNGLSICDYVENKGVKEVWLWMYHTDKTYPVESYQRGPDHQLGNGFMNLPLCKKSYTVYDYNYTRGLGEALEDHTHHIERILAYIDNNVYWNLFTAGSTEFLQNNKTNYYDNSQAVYRCGWTHCPPNAIVADCAGTENQNLNRCTCLGYSWYNTRNVLSDCENWQPGNTGATQSINCRQWAKVGRTFWQMVNDNSWWTHLKLNSWDEAETACNRDDGGVSFKLWWLQNIPGKNNGLTYQEKNLRNWWDFVGDFDKAIQSERSFAL